MNTLDGITLRGLPDAARVLLTAFLLLIGVGYAAALGNLYQRLQFADERPGLSFDDLMANFRGLKVEAEGDASADAADEGPPVARSRMLEQVEPGGDMRKEIIKGGEPAIRALTGWLRRGALEEEFGKKGLAQPGYPSARRVIERYCLTCHNVESGEKQDTPYGPDMFETDYRMIYVYAAPGTAKNVGPGGAVNLAGSDDADAADRTIAAQSLGQLLLVSHIHMLAMPVYTLILGGLFLLTSLPRGLRGPLAVLPMVALIFDFSAWWLARWHAGAVYVIPVAGAVHGAGIAVQVVCLAGCIWFGKRPVRT